MKKFLLPLSCILIVALLIGPFAAFSVSAADSGMYIPNSYIRDVTADAYAQDSYRPWYAFDDNPSTCWITPWKENATPYPHWIMAELTEPLQVDSLHYIPRQSDLSQRATDYEVWISPDRNESNLVKVAEGTWDWESLDAGTVNFTARTAILVKFVIKGIFQQEEGNPVASVGELRIHSAKKIQIPALLSTDMIEKVTASSYQPGYDPMLAFNDDSSDFWHTPWEGDITDYPHWIMAEFKEAVTIGGLLYTPRSGTWEQFVTAYEVWISPDSNADHLVKVAEGDWNYGPFGQCSFTATEAKLVKFVLKSCYGTDVNPTPCNTASVAELDFRTTESAPEEPSYIEPGDIKTVTASDFHPDYPPERLVNDNPGDFWHTRWGEGASDFPHWVMVEFKEPQVIDSLLCLPRLDALGSTVSDYEVWISPDSNPDNLKKVDAGTWATGVTGVSTFSAQKATLVKFVINAKADGQDGTTGVAVAELKFRLAKEETLTPDAKQGYSFYYQERAGEAAGTVDLRILCVIDRKTLEKRPDCDITVTVTAGETKTFRVSFDTVYQRISAKETLYYAAEDAYLFGVVITGVPDSYDGAITAGWTNGG